MQKYGAEREKLKDLLAESIRMGISLDAKFNEGNTLLHFAVALDMYDQVVYLLEAGANYLITNKEGLSPRDIALEAGNQRVLCLFRRESWYRLYTHAGNENYNPDKDSREHNAQVLSQIAQPAVGFADLSYSFWINNGFVGVSENFLDWTDSQICTHLQDLLELFRVQEQKFLSNLETMRRQREESMMALSSMHQPLRNHEHKICRKLFTVQELVRQYRDKVNAYAEEKMTYKQEIRALREKVYYHSVCEQRVHNGYLVKLWKYCCITVTGEYLIISDSTSLSAAAATACSDGPCAEGDQDVTGGSDCCRHGRHRIPVRDIYHVETLRTGFHSSTPSVSFGITLRQQGVKDCRHLQTISTTSSSTIGSNEKAPLVKLRKLTLSIPAVPLEKEKRPPKKSKSSPPIEDDGSDGFPVKLDEVMPTYFDEFSSEDKRRAHVFLLALRATSHKIRFGGNYLPPGWASLRRRSSASRERTPASESTPSPAAASGGQRKGKIENFLDRIFSGDRDAGGTPTSVSSTPATGSQSASGPSGAYNSAEKRKVPSSVPREIERPSVSEDETRRGSMSQRGTATSRESTSTQQSHSYSSTASASSLPRLSLLHKTSSSGSSETSRNSGAAYTDSSRDSSTNGRPSVAPTDAVAGGYAHTCLETVAEREERQFSSDSEGHFSCKLAAHLAGIVSESVAEPTVSGYGLRRKRSSSSIASNVDTSSMCSGTASASASGGLADTPPLGWEIMPDPVSPRGAEVIAPSARRTVHYEHSRESSVESGQPNYRPADLLSSSAQEDSYLASAGGVYDIEALSEPSLLRSKSLPFKLPSSDCLAGGSDDATVSGDDGAAGPRHLADIDAEELERVTAGRREDTRHRAPSPLADWRSVASASEVAAETAAATGGFCLSETSGPVTVQYTTPEKAPRPSFLHPLLSPCTQEGIDVRTSESKCTSSVIDSGGDDRGRITPPSNQSGDTVCRGRADSGWDTLSEDGRLRAGESSGLKIMQCPSTEDSVSMRIKNDVISSPTALLVRATPDSPSCTDAVAPSPYPGGVPNQLSPLLRKQKKTPIVRRWDTACSLDDETQAVERLSIGATRRSTASNSTDPPDDFGHFTDGSTSMSHHSAFDADRLSLLYSPRYSTMSGVGGFRDTLGSMEDEMLLGMVYDPNDPCKPTSRMTIAAGSPPTSVALEPPSRRISGLCLLPCGGIDSPSVLKAGLAGPPVTTPANRNERASFCCGSAQSNLSTKQEAIDTLKKEPSPGAATRRGSHKNKMIRFRTLEDVMKALAKIRDISAVGEERLSIALNDREVEHQKFTYLLALRGIVDHLPRVEDRIQFLSGSGRSGAAAASLPGHVIEDSPGGNSGTGYNMNSSHSATAILAAATASFAAANSSCNNTMIGDDDGPRSSIHSMSGRYSIESASSGYDFLSTGLDCNDAVGSDCRVLSKDFTDMAAESVCHRKFDACFAPSPLLLASAKSRSTGGGTEDVRLDSVSTSRLSSVDRDVMPVPRRSISKSSCAATVTPHRGSLGPSDRPGLASSPAFGGGLFKQFSEESVGTATSIHAPDAASRASLREYINERFGAEVAASCDVHALPPVTAVLCVPMGQRPEELLDKYNTVFSLLKSIYSLDKAIFDHLQRLAELCQLKDDLRNRYWSLQNQANKVSAPRAGDLYDVDL